MSRSASPPGRQELVLGRNTIYRMSRRRISVTVDPLLLEQVDRFVAQHPGLDRSKVFDAALAVWYAARQEQAMAAQYSQDPDLTEIEERASWRRIQDAAASSLL